jgi:hypothetical protein
MVAAKRHFDAETEFWRFDTLQNKGILFESLTTTCPINAAGSQGRRNTKLAPLGLEKKPQNRSLGLEQQERYPG